MSKHQIVWENLLPDFAAFIGRQRLAHQHRAEKRAADQMTMRDAEGAADFERVGR